MWWLIIALLLIISLLSYKYGTLTFDRLRERGIEHAKPLPFVGNFLSILFYTKGISVLLNDYYKRFGRNGIFGMYMMHRPIIVVAKPEYIEQIMKTGFENFSERFSEVGVKDEPVATSVLFLMKGDRWRNMRQSLKHIFENGSMRGKFNSINENIEQCIAYFWNQQQRNISNGGSFELDMLEPMMKLSLDVVCTTMFGLKVNSFEQLHKFYPTTTLVMNSNFMTHIYLSFIWMFPRLSHKLGIRIFGWCGQNDWQVLLQKNLQMRINCNIYRSDLLQLLMGIQRESIHNWSDNEILAQGFEALYMAIILNTILICQILYDLVDNPEVQDRLYNEIVHMERERGEGPISFEYLQSVKYLDLVLLESMRKQPIPSLIHRVCTKKYSLCNKNGESVFEFKKGDIIFIPNVSLHYDPAYFECPENYRPERFDEENKQHIHPCTFLPLGLGPRNCIAKNFVDAHVKAAVYQIILKYRVVRCKKTAQNILKEYKGLHYTPRSRFWMRMVPR